MKNSRYFQFMVVTAFAIGITWVFFKPDVESVWRSFDVVSGFPQILVSHNSSCSATKIVHTCQKIEKEILSPWGLVYSQSHLMTPGRGNVLTVSPWLAPIVWEGTFDPALIDGMYLPLNLTIATTVFAVGKYTRFLKDFLESAEKYYLPGFKVHYYIFTDQPEEVPSITLAPGRSSSVILVPKFNRWQEISLRRMEIIRKTIEEEIRETANYIYCLDVDMLFYNRWGAEVFGQLVAALHPWFYHNNRNEFPYERRSASKAYIPITEGDFYYRASTFGGLVEDVYKLTKTCEDNLNRDKANDIEAIWQEESHFNHYLIYHKPTKLLSPEYQWDDLRGDQPSEIKVIKFSSIVKNKNEVREN